MIFLGVAIAFIFVLLVRAFIKKDFGLIPHLIAAAAPMLIAISGLWLWGSGYTYPSVILVSLSIGFWLGYKIVFWRHFGRTLTEDESYEARNWLFYKK